MPVAMQLEPVSTLPSVHYRWDADTEILTASVVAEGPAPAGGDHANGPGHVAEGERVLATAPTSPPATVTLEPGPLATGPSGSIEVEGTDGSWLTLELGGGRIQGVQVAIWPPVRKAAALAEPPTEPARAVLAREERDAEGELVSLEVSTRLSAEADAARRTFHFIFGAGRPSRRARIADDLVIEIDGRSRLTGVWLLNVPPCPEHS